MLDKRDQRTRIIKFWSEMGLYLPLQNSDFLGHHSCWRRVKRLEELGVIDQLAALFNPFHADADQCFDLLGDADVRLQALLPKKQQD